MDNLPKQRLFSLLLVMSTLLARGCLATGQGGAAPVPAQHSMQSTPLSARMRLVYLGAAVEQSGGLRVYFTIGSTTDSALPSSAEYWGNCSSKAFVMMHQERIGEEWAAEINVAVISPVMATPRLVWTSDYANQKKPELDWCALDPGMSDVVSSRPFFNGVIELRVGAIVRELDGGLPYEVFLDITESDLNVCYEQVMCKGLDEVGRQIFLRTWQGGVDDWNKARMEFGENAITVRNSDGVSLLHVAAARGDSALCQALVDAGLDPNIGAGPYQHPPLLAATVNCRINAVERLMELGAKPSDTVLWRANSIRDSELKKAIIDILIH